MQPTELLNPIQRFQSKRHWDNTPEIRDNENYVFSCLYTKAGENDDYGALK